MEIQGSWCYTRGSSAASILSGEPSVPGEIPCGVARGSIPGASGVDPGRGAICSWEDSRWYDILSYNQWGSKWGWGHLIPFVYTRSDQRFVYNRGVNPYSHQRPCGGERLGSQYTPVERLQRRLRD